MSERNLQCLKEVAERTFRHAAGNDKLAAALFSEAWTDRIKARAEDLLARQNLSWDGVVAEVAGYARTAAAMVHDELDVRRRIEAKLFEAERRFLALGGSVGEWAVEEAKLRQELLHQETLALANPDRQRAATAVTWH